MLQANLLRSPKARLVACSLLLLLMAEALPMAAAQRAPSSQKSALPQSAQQQNGQSPLPFPAVQDGSSQQNSAPDASLISQEELPSAPIPQSPDSTPQQQAPKQPPPPLPQQPVGTAAAPADKPTGIPGSRPAGVAIAPAKQKRVRAFVISFGIALAAGAAIGTVVGLSRASHSTPQ